MELPLHKRYAKVCKWSIDRVRKKYKDGRFISDQVQAQLAAKYHLQEEAIVFFPSGRKTNVDLQGKFKGVVGNFEVKAAGKHKTYVAFLPSGSVGGSRSYDDSKFQEHLKINDLYIVPEYDGSPHVEIHIFKKKDMLRAYKEG